ncbi:TIGR01777 family protein [Gammaproteobacteria bacterium LSUCC0112]|nr:TIGR01777 family protein [Gammaproteobacteria bacterium LSUCC0112]
MAKNGHVLITGGTGFVGKPLSLHLINRGWRVTVLVRDYARSRQLLGAAPTLIRSLDEIQSSDQIDVMINLAGAGIADQRWSHARKQILLDSRVRTTRGLVALAQRLERKPAVLISASAIGFYGSSGDQPLDELASGGVGFAHELCKRWEEEASKAEALGMRVCILRLGVVLGSGGGMLGRLLPIFKMGLGGKTGNGKQVLSWIHRDDVIEVMDLMMQADLQGVFNVTAPEAVTNARFSKLLADSLKRPCVFHQPATIVQLMFGEMGEQLLLNGQHVVPSRLLNEGYGFRYPALGNALDDIIHRSS